MPITLDQPQATVAHDNTSPTVPSAQIVVDGPDQPDIFQSIKAGSGGSGGH
jgi:hypothetical protein